MVRNFDSIKDPTKEDQTLECGQKYTLKWLWSLYKEPLETPTKRGDLELDIPSDCKFEITIGTLDETKILPKDSA